MMKFACGDFKEFHVYLAEDAVEDVERIGIVFRCCRICYVQLNLL